MECDDPTEDLIAPKSSRIGTEMFSYDAWLIKEANVFGFVKIGTWIVSPKTFHTVRVSVRHVEATWV